MFGRIRGRVGVAGVLVGLAGGIVGCTHVAGVGTSDEQDVVASHDVGVDWAKRVRATLDGVSTSTGNLKAAALKVVFTDPGSQAARDASAALGAQIAADLKDLTRVLDELDLVLEEDVVLGKGHGTVAVPEETGTNVAGQSVAGLRPVRAAVARAQDLVSVELLPLLSGLTSASLEARGQAVMAFQTKVDALGVIVDGLRTDIGTWSLAPAGGAGSAGLTWVDPLTSSKWTVAINDRVAWSNAGDMCTALGDGWRLPSVDAMRAARERLAKSGLVGLDLGGVFWSRDVSEAVDFRTGRQFMMARVVELQTGDENRFDVAFQVEPDGGRPLKAMCVK